MNRSVKHIVFLIIFGVLFYLVLFPGPISWASRIEPMVGPFSFFMAWVIGISGVIIWLTLVVLYLVEAKTNQLEPEKVSEVKPITGIEKIHPSERALHLVIEKGGYKNE
jgi:hypothetical protein